MQRRRFNIGIRQYSIILGGILALILIVLYVFNANRVTTTTSDTHGIQITGGGVNEYRTVIKNGRYQVSQARGITAPSFGNDFNVSSFENGLLSTSQKVFKPKSYIFQEGQYLKAKKVTKWLGRKSKKNPQGLNPKDNGAKTASQGRRPIYLQSLEEMDFMEKKGNKLALRGMTIGLAMNRIDEYTKKQYGPTYEQHISRAEMEAQGRKIAKKVVKRLRQTKGISKGTPIMVVTYEAAGSDSLVGGNVYSYAVSQRGTTFDGWRAVNEKNVVFPKTSKDTSQLGNSDNDDFANFSNEVKNFFPNLSGVTAQARYDGNSLKGMDVDITTQFYSSTEISSFVSFISSMAPKYLPSGVPIRIVVHSDSTIQAVLTRSNGGKFDSVVLDSY